MARCLQQNEIADMFAHDYRDLSDTDVITGNKSDTNLKEYQSFTDLRFSKDKLITCIDWHPAIKGTQTHAPKHQQVSFLSYFQILYFCINSVTVGVLSCLL